MHCRCIIEKSFDENVLDFIFTRVFYLVFFFGYIFFRTLFPVILFLEPLLVAPILF